MSLNSPGLLSEDLDIISVNWNKSEIFSLGCFFILDKMKTVLILTEKRICSLLDGCHLDCRTSRSADTINHCPDGHVPASVSSRWQQLLGFRRRFPLRTSERFNKTEQSRIFMPLPSGNNNRSERQRPWRRHARSSTRTTPGSGAQARRIKAPRAHQDFPQNICSITAGRFPRSEG